MSWVVDRYITGVVQEASGLGREEGGVSGQHGSPLCPPHDLVLTACLCHDLPYPKPLETHWKRHHMPRRAPNHAATCAGVGRSLREPEPTKSDSDVHHTQTWPSVCLGDITGSPPCIWPSGLFFPTCLWYYSLASTLSLSLSTLNSGHLAPPTAEPFPAATHHTNMAFNPVLPANPAWTYMSADGRMVAVPSRAFPPPLAPSSASISSSMVAQNGSAQSSVRSGHHSSGRNKNKTNKASTKPGMSKIGPLATHRVSAFYWR